MPDYRVPGVYVQETSSGLHTIEGVEMGTAAFVGPTRWGPVAAAPSLLTSPFEFHRIFGGSQPLEYGVNHLAHSVRGYFHEGGTRLFVVRACHGSGRRAVSGALPGAADHPNHPGATLRLMGRFPGSAGNGSVTFRERLDPVAPEALPRAPVGSLIRVGRSSLYRKVGPGVWLSPEGLPPEPDLRGMPREIPMALLSLEIVVQPAGGQAEEHRGLGFDPGHPRWAGAVLGEEARGTPAPSVVLAVDPGLDGFLLRGLLLSPDQRPGRVSLTGGSDGGPPDAAAYASALERLEPLAEVSVVAAPGHSALEEGYDLRRIQGELVRHAERPRAWRVALLDTPRGWAPHDVLRLRAGVESSHAAFYHPWVVVADPTSPPPTAHAPGEISLPPSGLIAGIYARNDRERGVHAAPANLPVRGALRLEQELATSDQEQLNPAGVNCLRTLPGRGHRVWGARLASSDPEWKYVNVRRYHSYVERSLHRGLEWVASQPNGEPLWADVRRRVLAFLHQEWTRGALRGVTPEEAWFVRCDRSTMGQADLERGELVLLVGLALLKPAEFFVLRMAWKTADAAP